MMPPPQLPSQPIQGLSYPNSAPHVNTGSNKRPRGGQGKQHARGGSGNKWRGRPNQGQSTGQGLDFKPRKKQKRNQRRQQQQHHQRGGRQAEQTPSQTPGSIPHLPGGLVSRAGPESCRIGTPQTIQHISQPDGDGTCKPTWTAGVDGLDAEPAALGGTLKFLGGRMGLEVRTGLSSDEDDSGSEDDASDASAPGTNSRSTAPIALLQRICELESEVERLKQANLNLKERLELAEEGSSPMASSGQGSGLPEDPLGFFHQPHPEAEASVAPTEQQHAQGSEGPAAH